MERFLGIRDLVPGTYPHPAGQDPPARERFPFTSPFRLHQVSPEPHQKNELEEKKKAEQVVRDVGEGFPPLGRTDYPQRTVGRLLGAKNEVPAVGLGPRASPPLSCLLCFKTTKR